MNDGGLPEDGGIVTDGGCTVDAALTAPTVVEGTTMGKQNNSVPLEAVCADLWWGDCDYTAPDAMYSIDVPANHVLVAEVQTGTAWDSAIYLSADCPPNTSCLMASDDYYGAVGPNGAECVVYSNVSSNQNVYVFVDGCTSTESGPYSLSVKTIENQTQTCTLSGTPLEVESNNTTTTATDLGVVSVWENSTREVFGTVDFIDSGSGAGVTTLLPDEDRDVDIYKFTAQACNLIEVDVEPNPGSGSNPASQLTPSVAIGYDDYYYGFTSLSSNSATAANPKAHAEYLLSSGADYYIRVGSDHCTGLGGKCYGYKMTVKKATPVPTEVPFGTFPSSSHEKEIKAGFGSFFSFTVPAGPAKAVAVHVARATKALMPWLVVVKPETCAILGQSQWFVPKTYYEAGTYWVIIGDRTGRGGADYKASIYTIDLQESIGNVSEGEEPNHSVARATALGTLPVKAAGSLFSGDDKDWYVFTAPSPAENVTFETMSNESSPDTMLRILNATGTAVLAENDDIDYSDYLSKIEAFSATPGETYIVEVTSPTAYPWSGNYELMVTKADACSKTPLPSGTKLWINEVYPKPSSNDGENSLHDEFVEVVHDLTGGEVVDLSDYSLRDLSSPRHVFACGSRFPLRPGGPTARAAVVFGTANHTIQAQGDPLVQVASVDPAYGLSLNNGGDVIVLVDPAGMEVDRFVYESGPYAESWQRCGDVPDGEIKVHSACGTGLQKRSPGQKQDLSNFNP